MEPVSGSLVDGARVIAYRRHFEDLEGALRLLGIELDRGPVAAAEQPSHPGLTPVPAALNQPEAPDGWGGEDDTEDPPEARGTRTDDVRTDSAPEQKQEGGRPAPRRSRVVASVLPAVRAVGSSTDLGAVTPGYRSVARHDPTALPARGAPSFPTRTIRSTLRSLTRVPRRSRVPDVTALVDVVARRKVVGTIPFLSVVGPPTKVRVFADASLPHGLWATDLDFLLAEARGVMGGERLDVLFFDDTPGAGAGAGPRPSWRSWSELPPVPATLLVRTSREPPEESVALARDTARARTQGTRVEEIVLGERPGTRRSDHVHPVRDDDARAAGVQAVLDAVLRHPFVDRSPVTALAVLVSTPPFVPARALRRTRRAVFGPGTLWIEAELAHSDIVEGVCAEGLELTDRFRRAAWSVLGAALVDHTDESARLRSLLVDTDDGTSPLLGVEERIVWASVARTDAVEIAEREFGDCVRTITREGRHGVADWAAAALRRLPDDSRSGPAAWAMSLLCTALGKHAPRIDPPEDAWDGALLREVLPFLPTTLVGFARDGQTLGLGTLTRRRRFAVRAPALPVTPLVVRWEADGTRHQERVDVSEGEWELPVGGRAVSLENLAGDIVELAGFEAGEPSPEQLAVEESLAVLDRAWRSRELLTAHVARPRSPRSAVVTFPAAPACTGLLRSGPGDDDLRSLHQQEVTVRISTVDRADQRVYCALVDVGSWDVGDLAVGQWVDAVVTNVAAFGVFVRVPVARAERSVSGLLHRSAMVDPDGEPWPGPGERVRVRVVSIDADERRIAFSTIVPPDPAAHPVGAAVTGTVRAVVGYGVMVELPSGFVALLHNEEIARSREFRVGDPERVRIKWLDADVRRVGLGTDPPLRPGTPTRELTDTRTSITPYPPPSPEFFEVSSPAADAAIRAYIRDRVRALDDPLQGAQLAGEVQARFGQRVPDTEWLGHGTFRALVEDVVPGGFPPGTYLRRPPGPR